MVKQQQLKQTNYTPNYTQYVFGAVQRFSAVTTRIIRADVEDTEE